MAPSLAKSLGGLIISIMTFLGWNISEYSYLLPTQMKQEIQIEQNSKQESEDFLDTPKQQNSDSTSTKAVEVTINKTEPTVKKVTSTQATSPSKSTKKTSAQKPVAPVTTPTPPAPVQPTYYPAPVPITDTVKNEIKNIVDEIIPPKTETETKKETQDLSVEDKIKKSVVNIYCTRLLGNQIQKITGSGIIIDASGIILTNAHVAEYFLLAQTSAGTNCYIRTSSPAVSSYKAKLIYLPSQWISSNENNLTMATLTGTGENDYALLAITERVRSDAPNIPLTFLTPSQSSPSEDQDIFVAGYPAGFSDVRILDSALYELTKPSAITRVSSFSGGAVDVINSGGTSVAEHGSSGGAVTDEDGNLIGLIAATNIDARTGDKNIQAITLSYIRRSIKNNSGKSFDSFISNARDEVASFEKNTAPSLANTLLRN
ncbi:MAG: serine protease [Patescibacteria group bacterium]